MLEFSLERYFNLYVASKFSKKINVNETHMREVYLVEFHKIKKK